jgi:hypothetical protein
LEQGHPKHVFAVLSLVATLNLSELHHFGLCLARGACQSVLHSSQGQRLASGRQSSAQHSSPLSSWQMMLKQLSGMQQGGQLQPKQAAAAQIMQESVST